MKHSSRRILALLLALSLCIGMMPMSIFAEPETEEINGQLEEIIELSQSPADDSADLEEESEGFDVSETDAKEAPEAVKKADVTVLEEKKVEEKKVDLEKVDLDKIEKDMPSALTEALPEAGNSDAQEDEKDEGDDVAGDDTVSFTLTVIWDDDNDAAGMRPDVDKFKAAMTLSYTVGDGGKVGTFNPTPESETEVQSDRYIFTWTGLKKADSRGNLYHYFAWAEIEKYAIDGTEANTLTYTLDNKAQMNFAKVWKGDEETDARPSTDAYGKCVTLYQYYPKTEEIATIDAAPVVTTAESDPNTYYVTWAELPRYADGQELVYYAKETAVPDGYLESYDNGNSGNASNAVKAAELPAADEAVFLKGTILNVYVGTTDFTVTVRWEDENDKYGNRPSAADFAEKMGLYLWSEINAKDYDPLHLSEREPKVTDNNDDTYTVTWENLPASFNGEDMLYIAREASPSSGYVGDYKNQLEYSGAPHLYGAYENGEIVNTTAIILFNVQKDWQDADNKDGERPDSITVHLLEGEQELASKTITEEDLWSGSFEGVYPAYRNGEPVEYAITEDPVPGYRTEIKEADYEEAAEEPDPADEEEEEVAVKRRIDVDPPEDDENSWNQIRTYKVTNIKVVDIIVNKIWDDADDADGFRPDVEEFAEKILELVVRAGNDDGTVIVKPEKEAKSEAKAETAVALRAYKAEKAFDTENNDQNRPTRYSVDSENENKYTVVWEGLDKYRGDEEIGYGMIENDMRAYTLTDSKTEKTADSIVWTFTNTHQHETCTFNVTKIWEDGDNAEGDRPESITLYLTADGAEEPVATLTITSDDNGNWTGAFEGNYPKYKDGKEIKYEVSEEPIEGYLTTIELNVLANAGGIDDGEFPPAQDRSVSETLAKAVKAAVKEEKETADILDVLDIQKEETEAPVTRYEAFVTNAKVVDVTVTKIWDDDNNHDGKRPGVKRFIDAVGLKLYAFLGYSGSSMLIKTSGEQGPGVKKNEDGSYTITWTGLLKYIKDDKGNYQEAKYYAKEDESQLKKIGYKADEESYVDVPHDPDGEDIGTVGAAAFSGDSIINKHTPEKISITVTKSWDVPEGSDHPESITIDLLANGEKVWEEPKTITEADDWTATYSDFYRYENGKEIKYTVEEEQLEGYSRPDYKSVFDKETSTWLLSIANSLPADPITITKYWDDNNDEDGNRPSPEELIETKAFGLMRSVGHGYETTYDFDPEIKVSPNNSNAYIVTWNNLPKYKDGREYVYLAIEKLATYQQTPTSYNSAIYNYLITSSNLGTEPHVDYESETAIKLERNMVYNGGSFTNTYRREIVQIKVDKIWDDNNNAHGKRPDSITVELWVGEEKTGHSLTITPDEEGNWTGTFDKSFELQRFKDGDEIQYEIKELEVDGYHTTYKNKLIPDPVDPSDPGNGTVEPGEPGEIVITPGHGDDDEIEVLQEADQEAVQEAAQDTLKRAVKAMKSDIPGQSAYVLETITITNKEYCTARWVYEDETPITPTEDGKYEPVEFDFDATGDDIPADNMYGDGPAKEGYTFAGWETRNEENGDITYIATYTQDSIIRYHSNYPDALEMTDLQKDEYYSESRPYTIADLERVGFEDLTEKGYKFLGWTTEEDGTGDEYAAGADYPADSATTKAAATSSAVSFMVNGIRSAASSSRAASDPTIVLELYAQWEPIEEEEPVTHTATWVDEDGTPLYGPKDFTTDDDKPAGDDYNELSGKENPTKPEDDENTYEFSGWKESTDDDGNVTYTAQYTATPKTTPAAGGNPTRPNTKEDPKTEEPEEEPTEIDNGETPLAGYEEDPAEETAPEDTPFAGYEEDPDEEVAEEPTPFSPFTGDARHTAVWSIISVLSLLGIVLVARKRREE